MGPFGKKKNQKQAQQEQQKAQNETDRDYKMHSNGTCGMSAGFQYAVAERKGVEGE